MQLSEQLESSKKLLNQANKFLQTKHFENILSKYGQVVYTGSYAADLMVWPDIDVQLILPDEQDKIDAILNVSKILLNDPDVKDVKLINFAKRKKPGMPCGMYVGVKIKDSDSMLEWKIDIWALEHDHYARDLEFHKSIMQKLTPELKEILIAWKYRLMGDNDRVPQLGSYYLYQAVLFEGLTEEKLIEQFLKKSGVVF